MNEAYAKVFPTRRGPDLGDCTRLPNVLVSIMMTAHVES
jgi:hypothetical protein